MTRIRKINEMSNSDISGDMFVRVDDIGFNKDYRKTADDRVKGYFKRTPQGFIMTFRDLKDCVDYVTSSMGCVCRITSDDDTKSYFCVFDNPSLRKGGDDRFFGEAYIGHINFSVVCYQDGFDMEGYIQSVK